MTNKVFDTHLHIIDPAHPLQENNGYMPDPFTVADYQERIEGLNIQGGSANPDELENLARRVYELAG